MVRKSQGYFMAGGVMLALSLLLTVAVLTVDVQPIGPQGTKVGLATLNGSINKRVGVNLLWYDITDWLGVVAIAAAVGFAVLGLVQWVKRKNLLRVDKSILALGIFYLIVLALYVLFEGNVVNYRPIIMYRKPEASFPSSHTMIVGGIMATAMIEFRHRIRNTAVRNIAQGVSLAIIAITIFGRLISGVHWFTDIAAGLLYSASVVTLYYAVVRNW